MTDPGAVASTEAPAEQPALNAGAVAAWLRAHPDFFAQHPDLLTELRLPHDSGETVSLVERQLSALRARNAELRSRLDGLVTTAEQNDRLFTQTTALVVDLLGCDGVGALQRCLARHLQHEFGAGHLALVLLDDDPDAGTEVRTATPAEAQRAIGHLLGQDDAFIGAIRGDEAAWLFPGNKAASSAVLRLHRDGSPLAVLAIGSDDPGRFGSDMGTLFIRHLGDVLVRLLP